MSHELSLKLIGFNELAAKNIAAIMFLAERRLSRPWRIVGNMDADFYLLPETMLRNMLSDEKLKDLPLQRCIFTVLQRRDSAPQFQVQTDENNIPRLHDLVAVFNNLSAEDADRPATPIAIDCAETAATQNFSLAPAVATAPRQVFQRLFGKPIFYGQQVEQILTQDSAEALPVLPEDIQPASEKALFKTNQGFLGCLLAHQDRLDSQVTITLKAHSREEVLYVYPGAQIFYSRNDFEQLTPLLSASDEELSVETRPGNYEDIKHLPGAEDFKPYSLSSLIWYAAFKTSRGRLLDGRDAGVVVKLSHWPDISLPGCRELTKLAAFMHGSAADLQTIADKLQLPIDMVIDFYNACKLIDIIEIKPQADIHQKQLSAEKSMLLAKIQSRLNRKSGAEA